MVSKIIVAVCGHGREGDKREVCVAQQQECVCRQFLKGCLHEYGSLAQILNPFGLQFTQTWRFY